MKYIWTEADGRASSIREHGTNVPSARKRFLNEVSQAKTFVEALPAGTHAITSKRGEGGYNSKSESTNWFLAIGGYTSWGRGLCKDQAWRSSS